MKLAIKDLALRHFVGVTVEIKRTEHYTSDYLIGKFWKLRFPGGVFTEPIWKSWFKEGNTNLLLNNFHFQQNETIRVKPRLKNQILELWKDIKVALSLKHKKVTITY